MSSENGALTSRNDIPIMRRMGHKEIIKALGEYPAVADWFSRETGEPFKPDTVYRWQQNGVPWRWRNTFAKLAKQKGVPLPKDFLSGAA